MKVAHDFEELNEGEDRILTLKDSKILDNEGQLQSMLWAKCRLNQCLEDELHDVEIAELERTKKRNELKAAKREYKGYDDDEFAEGQAGLRKSILAKYDEDIEGPQEMA